MAPLYNETINNGNRGADHINKIFREEETKMRKTKIEVLSPSGVLVISNVGKWYEYKDGEKGKELGSSYTCFSPYGDPVTVKIAGPAAVTSEQLEQKIENVGIVLARFENLEIKMYTDSRSGIMKYTSTADGIKIIEVELPIDL